MIGDYLLSNLRSRIDEIDQELLELILKRFDLVDQVADVKKVSKIPVFVPGREDEILDNIVSKVDPKYSQYVRDLFTSILDISKRYQIEKM